MDLEADGVHVGQTDIDAAEVRKVIGPDMLLGVSAQTVEQAKKAENDGADYIGSGAVFPSPTKPNAPHISLQDLKNIADSVNIPVVVIGGVNESNVILVVRLNCSEGLVRISSIFTRMKLKVNDIRIPADCMTI